MATSRASRRSTPHSSIGTLARVLEVVRRLPRIPLLGFMVALALSLVLVPTAYVSAPGKTVSQSVVGANQDPTRQDPVWLQAKLAHRVYSGIVRGQGKGAKSHPTILSAPLASYPASASVYTSGDRYSAEPGNGVAPSLNFPGGGSYDDKYNPYSDAGYFNLCGPGATDIAAFDWPAPPNDATCTESDPHNGQHTTATTTGDGGWAW